MGKGKIVKMENQVEDTENVVLNEEEVQEYKLLETKDLESLSDEELEAKLVELDTAQQEYAKHMNTKTYSVNIGTQTNLSLLKKWVEKEVRWNHKTVPTLVAMYDGLKKAIDAGVDEEGNAYLSSIVVANIYQYLLTFEGVGFIDAKKYLTLLTKVGGPISEAMKQLADDNQHFRNLHNDMATVDQVQEARRHGIKVEDTSKVDSSVTESPEKA
jgi:hypothetical protein